MKLLSKSLKAAEKNKEKVEANCTGFSADFFGTQSVEMPGKQKFKCWQLLAGACYLSGSLFLKNYDFIDHGHEKKKLCIFFIDLYPV